MWSTPVPLLREANGSSASRIWAALLSKQACRRPHADGLQTWSPASLCYGGFCPLARKLTCRSPARKVRRHRRWRCPRNRRRVRAPSPASAEFGFGCRAVKPPKLMAPKPTAEPSRAAKRVVALLNSPERPERSKASPRPRSRSPWRGRGRGIGSRGRSLQAVAGEQRARASARPDAKLFIMA